jgi:hypothetical protein
MGRELNRYAEFSRIALMKKAWTPLRVVEQYVVVANEECQKMRRPAFTEE